MKSNFLLNIKIVKNMALVALLIQMADMAYPNVCWSSHPPGNNLPDGPIGAPSAPPSITPEHIAKFTNGTLPEAKGWMVRPLNITDKNPRKEDITNIVVTNLGDGRFHVGYMAKGIPQEAIIVSKTKKLQGQKDQQKQGKSQGHKNPQGNKHHQ